jgi:N-acetylneuraminate synthase
VKNNPSFEIEGRRIGLDFEPLVIAELGINHGGDIAVAMEMAKAAIDSGAEIIKHQTHIIDDEMSLEAKHVIPGNADISIWEIMEQCALNENDEYALMEYVKSRGAIFISTPFSRKAVDRLVSFDVPAFKVGSGECNNYQLIKYIASKGKPVILSTGMNSIETIRPSVDIFRGFKIPYALLHTTNLYPTPKNLIRLGAMSELQEEFQDAVIGLSDHSTSNNACIGAVALGASILERHFTDSLDRIGPDIPCSMDPKDLRSLIQASKDVFLARGGSKRPAQEEGVTIAFAFSSVVADVDLNPGDILTASNIWVRRPAGGDFSSNDYEELFGRKVSQPVPKNTQLRQEHLADE